MQDRDLYAQILGVREPWRVETVDLKVNEDEVHVHITHDPGLEWLCPECGRKCPLYDHQPAPAIPAFFAGDENHAPATKVRRANLACSQRTAQRQRMSPF